ncbi:hypothetical protein SS50377_25406 [Spironucleus salmonicida]|uniref:Uncharacterized protein n=1 Tax=Spironucleus salmonicida TaxID=348837 RepID=V6LML3_9EUKA|nr:hypothetical protein SS50377_25406 [Spironucleus salmonicida]|eukprot:EST44951.1 Hypothetical protein SS50377_14968 [Spironucleus salmonicida]
MTTNTYLNTIDNLNKYIDLLNTESSLIEHNCPTISTTDLKKQVNDMKVSFSRDTKLLATSISTFEYNTIQIINQLNQKVDSLSKITMQ